MIYIHPTAVVETEDIGDGTYVGPFTYISERVKIGKNCKIYSASIGLPGEHPNGAEDKNGIVFIDDDVEIREYVTINTPLFGEYTRLDRGCYLMAKSHVGHDAHLKERVVLHTGAVIGGHSIIGRYCYMGLNCSTHPRAVLDDFCIVGANGVFKGYSAVGVVWAGVPAKPLKVNVVGMERHVTPEEQEVITITAKNFIRTWRK